MTECILCRDGLEHEWLGQRISPTLVVRSWPIHVIEHCAYYLCKELGDKCPNCCPEWATNNTETDIRRIIRT